MNRSLDRQESWIFCPLAYRKLPTSYAHRGLKETKNNWDQFYRQRATAQYLTTAHTEIYCKGPKIRWDSLPIIKSTWLSSQCLLSLFRAVFPWASLQCWSFVTSLSRWNISKLGYCKKHRWGPGIYTVYSLSVLLMLNRERCERMQKSRSAATCFQKIQTNWIILCNMLREKPFLPATYLSDKKGGVIIGNLSLQPLHVSATCPLVCADLRSVLPYHYFSEYSSDLLKVGKCPNRLLEAVLKWK